ncbi:MAG: YIP1 family protein [Candidatus Nanohaloarchaea archaeon]|nr:YIP1 family protein [Candidatus Nanohaloarchaea archaeon]
MTESLRWWVDTVRDVLKQPRAFFEELDDGSSFKTSSVFLLLTQALVAVGYASPATLGAGSLSQMGGFAAAAGGLVVGVLLFLVFMIVYGVASTLVMAGAFNVVYYYLGGDGGLAGTYQAFSYAQAIAVPSVIILALTVPFSAAGGGAVSAFLMVVLLAVGLYGLYIQLVGISELHDLTMLEAAVPYLVLIGLALLLAVMAVGALP